MAYKVDLCLTRQRLYLIGWTITVWGRIPGNTQLPLAASRFVQIFLWGVAFVWGAPMDDQMELIAVDLMGGWLSPSCINFELIWDRLKAAALQWDDCRNSIVFENCDCVKMSNNLPKEWMVAVIWVRVGRVVSEMCQCGMKPSDSWQHIREATGDQGSSRDQGMG